MAFESQGHPIPDLFPRREIPDRVESAGRSLLGKLNQIDLSRYGAEDALLARIRSHELAAKMQLAVPEVTDVSQETEAVRESYGINGKETADFGKNCLLMTYAKGGRSCRLFQVAHLVLQELIGMVMRIWSVIITERLSVSISLLLR